MLKMISTWTLFLLTLNQTQLSGQNSQYNVLVIRDDISGTPEMIYNDVQSLGFNTTFKNADSVNNEYLNNFHAVILSCGRNENAFVYSDLRNGLISYALNRSGGIIIEGGNIGYTALIPNSYLAFSDKVLKILEWNSHDGGNLILNSDYIYSNLIKYPNSISATIELEYAEESDQDIVKPVPQAQLLFKTERNNDRAGILVFPNENIDYPRIINLFFNYSTLIDRPNAINMLENFLYHIIQNTISIKQINQNVPLDFKLYQNYPNPFNPETKIGFDVSKPTFVKLEIFDAIGRLIDIPLEQFMQPGQYVLIFPGNRNVNLKSGIYYYMMKTEDIIECKKMILIK